MAHSPHDNDSNGTTLTSALPTAHSVHDALHCAEEEFSARATLAVMGRAPSPAEAIRVHEDRARGVSRAAVLRSLIRIAAAEGKPAPHDWPLALPRRIDVGALLAQALPVDEFIARAYDVILGRPPAPHEIHHQRRALRWPRSRSDFIAALAASPEAERRGDIVLTGLGRRGPSLQRFIAGFRGSSAPNRDVHHDIENALAPVREMLQANTEQLAGVARQLAPLSSVAIHAQSTAAAVERMRTRSEVEGAKTAEIAADTRSLHESLRDMAERLVDVSRVVTLLAERSQVTHDGTAAILHELIGSTRMLAEIPVHLRESTAAISKLHVSGMEMLGIAVELRDMPAVLQRLSAASLRVEETVRTEAQIVHATQAAVSDMNATLQNIDRRVLPPVVPAGETVVTQVDGFSVGVPAREWRLSTYYHTRGPLEPGVYKLFQKMVRPGMTVVDVGANVGLYTLLAARLLQGKGRIFSFEPTPAIFHLLRENVRLNGFAETGVVRLHELALSDHAGDASLYTDRLDSTHNSLFPESSQTEEMRIRTAPLDDVLGVDAALDFVKIDAEGSEPLVLRGMERLICGNRGIRIVMEFAPGHVGRAGRNPADVLEEILSVGFLIRAIDPLTGDLTPASREELVSRENTDIFLARQ